MRTIAECMVSIIMNSRITEGFHLQVDGILYSYRVYLTGGMKISVVPCWTFKVNFDFSIVDQDEIAFRYAY